MNSYAIYRIAETLRVLLFMVLAILVFNFYPVTAVMIVMIAVLNDGAILSIAYDNVHYKNQPEAWNMRLVLGIATVLGVVGPIAAFGLFYLGDRVLHLGHPQLQTSDVPAALSRRTSDHLPHSHPWPALVYTPRQNSLDGGAGDPGDCNPDCGLRAVHGASRLEVGRLVWGYALVWALVTDRVKLLGYRILDPTKEPLLAKKPPVDRTPQIAARAYELYQQRVHGESQQDQDWLEAERETRNNPPVSPKVA